MRDNSANITNSKEKKEKTKTGTLPENAIRTCFINRELSWLEFNLRVLQEAADHKNPLLERMKFLMIYESNLEEFFRVRVGILTHRDKLMPDRKDPLSGWTPSEILDQIMVKVSIQQALAEGIWKTLKEELKAEGVDILDFKKISKVDELMCKKHFIGFRHLLSPRIIEPGRPFPFLWNQESYVIAVLGRDPDPRMAVIPLFRFPAYTAFELDGRQKIVLTARLVRQFLPNLLKKEEIRESAVISVTRNADVFIEENADNEDFRDKMTKVLKKRRRELPVRLQVFGKLSPATKTLLAKKFNISEKRIFTTSIPFDLSFRSAIREKKGYKYEERKPARNIGLSKGQYFNYLKHNDILISCPFQNMVPFVDLLYEAVDDPDVLSIKITLYRLSSSSKVAAALAYAADRGKDVLCLLELRARFDEQSNIDYSEMLEDAGCRVIYGLPDQKVHSKLCLITKQTDGNITHITQVGTGNYNEVTSEQYTDLSLITSDENVAQDAEMVFAALEAGEFPPKAKALWVAPNSFKSNLLEFMDREIEKGPEGKICIKANSLNNQEIMQKLIECSKAGVKVELFIRGICCLRPGIPGLTENITVKSVVGRWLEHSRIYQFGSGEDERIFIGSGDLLNRNLERRVEVFIEVKSEDTREQIHEILNAFRDDREKARTMQPDGTYVREKGGKGTSSQERLYRYFVDRKISPVIEEDLVEEQEEELLEEPLEVQPEEQQEVPLEERNDLQPVSTDALNEIVENQEPEIEQPQVELEDPSLEQEKQINDQVDELVAKVLTGPISETVVETEAETEAETETEVETKTEISAESEADVTAETTSEAVAEPEGETAEEETAEEETETETCIDPEAEIATEAASDAAAAAEAEAEPESVAEVETTAESEADTATEATSDAAAAAEAGAEPESVAEVETTAEPEADTATEDTSESVVESETVEEAETVPETGTTVEPEKDLSAEQPVSSDQPEKEDVKEEPKPEPVPEPEPKKKVGFFRRLFGRKS